MNTSPQSQLADERRETLGSRRKAPSPADRRYWIVLAAVAVLLVAQMLAVESRWLFNRDIVAFSRNVPRVDRIDVPMLLGSLAAKPTFVSTFAWWHESWAKQAPYWRPLTMQTFWLEKRLFSLDRYDRWMWVTFVLGMVYAVLLGIYVHTLTGRRDLALLSVALFTLPSPLGHFQNIIPTGPNSALVLGSWKDQPDLWANSLILAALVLTHRRRFGWALACSAVAVCFKESGWLVFPLCFVQLLAMRRLRELPPWVYGVSVVVVLTLLAFRYSAGPEVVRGYHMGSNTHWRNRYVNALEGLYFSFLFSFLPGWLLGHALYAGALAVRRLGPVRGVLSFLAMAVGVAFCYARIAALTVPEAIVGLLDPENNYILVAVLTAVWLFGAVSLARNRSLRNWAAYFFVLGAISATTFVAATQVLSHALHLAMSFQSVIVAAMILAVAERILPRLRKPFSRSAAPISSPA